MKMCKIYLIISFIFSTVILSFAQNSNSDLEIQTNKNLIVLPMNFLPAEESEVMLLNNENEQRKESILEIKKDNLSTKIEEDKLKMAGLFLKKGGEQIKNGGIISAVALGAGILLLSTAGNSSNKSYSGVIVPATILSLTGIIIGSILRISGGANISKAGKILAGEPPF